MNLPDQREFGRVVKALAPYLDQLVFVGAWCHRLLRFHPLALPPSQAPLMTEDADIAMPDRMPRRTPSLDAALKAAGFKARLSGSGPVPVTKYYPDGNDKGLYVEFIAALRGSGYTRSGDPNDVSAIAGVTAQRLRYVDLLLFEPWQLELSEHEEFELGTGRVVVRVASPASYLVQKVLTLPRRSTPAKRAKDALYIHDTLMMFGDAFLQLREPGVRVMQQLPIKTRREFHEQCIRLFQDRALMIRAETSVAATGRANSPSADTIAAVCSVGLLRVFAP